MKKGNGLQVRQDRLEEVLLLICKAAVNEQGVFRGGINQYLPQHNVPDDATDLEKARMLFTRVQFDRLMSSRVLMKKMRACWFDPARKWVYDPHKVRGKEAAYLDNVLSKYFAFGLSSRVELSPGTRFKKNADRLVRKYDGDPRNIINNRTFYEARRNMMEFAGMGTGLSNLCIMELLDAGLAEPKDPENVLFKADRHHCRIALNTDAVALSRSLVHHDDCAEPLENAYPQAARALSERYSFVRATLANAAVWVQGAECCSKKDKGYCFQNCPLFKDHCKGLVKLEHERGVYRVFEETGQRTDIRKDGRQRFFEF